MCWSRNFAFLAIHDFYDLESFLRCSAGYGDLERRLRWECGRRVLEHSGLGGGYKRQLFPLKHSTAALAGM